MPGFEKFFDVNQKMWDACVDTHVKSDFYQMKRFLAGENVLDEIVREGIGDVKGKTILHLQCHFGQDSICLAKMGAKVTGIDFSAEAVNKAKELNEKLGTDVRFIQSNVYELPEKLNEKFDIVFTSYGAICWLHDLKKWGEIINLFLKQGGNFYMAEFHPTLYLFDFETQEVKFDYFGKADLSPVREEEEGTYTDGGEDLKLTSYYWPHSLHEVMGALLRQNLRITDFQEFPFSPFNCFPNMHETGKNRYRFGDFKTDLPLIYSIEAVK